MGERTKRLWETWITLWNRKSKSRTELLPLVPPLSFGGFCESSSSSFLSVLCIIKVSQWIFCGQWRASPLASFYPLCPGDFVSSSSSSSLTRSSIFYDNSRLPHSWRAEREKKKFFPRTPSLPSFMFMFSGSEQVLVNYWKRGKQLKLKLFYGIPLIMMMLFFEFSLLLLTP